eukprot:PITA_19001
MIDNKKPVQQKLRKIHPNLENQIKTELNMLLKAKIILPIRHSKWVSNMVPVRKKNRDIRICIDFRNLNKACQKDNFPLPPMEQILQAVAGLELMSFLDGFSGYNQVLVNPDDQLKTTFRTKWGTYAYRKMPFGLINVGATFQRAMDIAFKGLVNKFVVIYLDDITVYSKKRGDHLKDLKQIFQRCLRFFTNHISFTNHDKKASNFKWGQDEHEAFNLIKQAITNAPSFATPNFSKPFILYTFASNKSYSLILTQTNQEKVEAPIAFFSSNLQGAELNYSAMEKQAYVVFKAIKYFRPFLLKTHTKIIVPFPAVRNLLVQKDVGEKRANWVIALQEYDREIKPTNIVRGQGFCKMLAGASRISEIPSVEVQVCKVSLNDEQSLYADIIFYLKNGYAPSYLDYTKKRALRLKAKQYQFINDILFRMNYDSVLLRCLEKSKSEKVL